MNTHSVARWNGLFSILFAVLGCGSSGSGGPLIRPAPVALPPVENLPPVVQPPVPAPAAAVFAYAPGSYRYEIRNDATISAVGGDSRVDTVSTRTVIAFRVAALDGDSLDVQGVIDTFSVSGGHGATIPPLAQPVPFHFTATRSGSFSPSAVDSASVCGAPLATLTVAAHDLLPAIPIPLANGAAWQDSTTTITCRAMIPVIGRAFRSARAEWVVVPPEFSRSQSQPGYRILRTTTGTLAGDGQAAGRQVLLTGTSSTTSALYLSPSTGILLGGVGEATTRLIVDTGTQRQEFVQQLRQQITLLY